MQQIRLKHGFFLFLAALIWGVAFVAQSAGMEYVGPCTFNGARCLMGAAVLFPAVWSRKRRAARERDRAGVQETEQEIRKSRNVTWTGGILCGLALCFASLLQQIGIQYTAVGKAGFITALYIVIVPVIGLLLGRKAGGKVWAGALLAVAGLYLLCVNGGLSLGKGDLLVFCCAILFSVHILVIDHFSPKADGVELSCIQFLVSGVICTGLAFILEKPSLGGLLAGWLPLLYAGIFSCGVAYTLQIIGQRDMEPSAASLILSLESVVSVLAGWLLLGQKLTGKELSGCALVFAAVVLVQLPERKKGVREIAG